METGENPDASATPQSETTSSPEGAAHTAPHSTAAPSTRLTPFPSRELRTWAVLAHLLAIPGYMTGLGFLGWVGPLVIWIKQRTTDPFVAYHALQSLFFQLIWTALLFVGGLLVWFWPAGALCWLLASALPVVGCVVAAVRTYLGEWYQYPWIGAWALDLTEAISEETTNPAGTPADSP